MLPLSDGVRARRFPVVNIALIVANFAVWLFYELPHLDSAVYHASFYACAVDSACRAPEPWGLSWITSMFLHGSWDHILGNMDSRVVTSIGSNTVTLIGHVRAEAQRDAVVRAAWRGHAVMAVVDQIEITG